MATTTPKDWHREDIKAAIRKTGITLQRLSLQHGLAECAARCVLHRPWPRVQAIIAQHLGIKPHIIWPSRYDTAGRPLKGISSPKRDASRRRASAHQQKVLAA